MAWTTLMVVTRRDEEADMTPPSLPRRAVLKGVAFAATTLAVGTTTRTAHAAARRVNVFMGTTPDFGNIWVAQLKGFFAEENINANIRLFPSRTAATDAFRAGVAEFVGCGDIPSARLWETMGTRYIAPVCYDSYTSVLMVKSAIQTGEQLRGKTLATRLGSSMELMVEQTFQKFGLASGAA